MPFYRLHLRHKVAYVLLAWVLALGVSVAHACGLASRVAAAGHGGEVTPVPTALAHRLVGVAHAHEQPPAADNVNCVKFCNEAKAANSDVNAITAAAPALLNSMPLPSVQAGAPGQPLRTARRQDQARRPPRSLPIELLRLTL